MEKEEKAREITVEDNKAVVKETSVVRLHSAVIGVVEAMRTYKSARRSSRRAAVASRSRRGERRVRKVTPVPD